MTQFNGSCLCGAVTYEADCEIQRIVNCHCIDCQKATGSVHTTMVFVPEPSRKSTWSNMGSIEPVLL
jgi:hypothetical protein